MADNRAKTGQLRLKKLYSGIESVHFLTHVFCKLVTALKIIWRVDEEDDEELDDDEDDEEEESWLELVDTIFHSAAGCELSIILESVPRICDKMSRDSLGSVI